MTERESRESRESLEQTVQDAYIVSVRKKGTAPLSAEELQQRFAMLVQRAEQLQQHYGIEKFSYRRFEFTPAIGAVIKGERQQEIIGILQSEGYAVKEQGRMSAQTEKKP